jgi:bifunctional polynucleotide phosphatase/kinase
MVWIEKTSYMKWTKDKLEDVYLPLRIAAFDLDDTLIIHSWTNFKDDIPHLLDYRLINKINELISQHYLIVVFSNQAGMSRPGFDKGRWKEVIRNFFISFLSKVKNQHYYFSIYVSKNHDNYRKPHLGMWYQMKRDLRKEFGLDNLTISKKSFYCGDAAGRKIPGPIQKKIHPRSKGDFSDSDVKFAENIGITFMTPDEFILG